jgi:hypothetical protein
MVMETPEGEWAVKTLRLAGAVVAALGARSVNTGVANWYVFVYPGIPGDYSSIEAGFPQAGGGRRARTGNYR